SLAAYKLKANIVFILAGWNRLEADMMVLVQTNRKLKKYLILSWVAFALFLLLS
ncbi:hypothetical protein Tco_0848823, partial [Tanacetum coccineum]